MLDSRVSIPLCATHSCVPLCTSLYLPVPLNWVLGSIPLSQLNVYRTLCPRWIEVWVCILLPNIKCKKCGFPCPALYCNCLYLHCCYIVFLLYLPVGSLPQQLMREHYTYYLTQLLGSQPLIPSFPRLLLLLSDICHRSFSIFNPFTFFKLVGLPQI